MAAGLLRERAGAFMRTKFCDLIVISPESPKIWKIHVTPQAVLILAMAFLISFSAAAAVTYGLSPEKVNDVNRGRLEAENRVLRIKNKDLQVGVQRVNSQVSRLEKTSERIKDLVASE
jgi:hypothetical protein